MADTVTVDLVTPERHFATTDAQLVEVPGGEGDFGVLPGHSPLVSSIRPGLLKLHKGGNDTERYLVMGGIAEVNQERCVILAEYLEDVTAVDLTVADRRLADAQKANTQAIGEEDKRAAKREIAVAEALYTALAGA
ncbi:MAG: ATP synthase F1 subunit epsilon [Rickettsiales bacterium]